MNGDVALSNGSTAARDTKITISATNTEIEEVVRISIKNGGKLECDCVLTPDFSFEPFYLGGALIINVYIPEDPNIYYTFTVENECEEYTEMGGSTYINFRWDSSGSAYDGSEKLDLTKAYLEGTVFSVYVVNNSSDNYLSFELYINDSIKSRFSVRPNSSSCFSFIEMTGNVKLKVFVRVDD